MLRLVEEFCKCLEYDFTQTDRIKRDLTPTQTADYYSIFEYRADGFNYPKEK